MLLLFVCGYCQAFGEHGKDKLSWPAAARLWTYSGLAPERGRYCHRQA